MKPQIFSYVLTICVTLLFSSINLAQAPEKSPGVQLFEKGDFAGAIELLKKSGDLVDLHYLGNAYEKMGNEKEARNGYDLSFRSGYKEFGEEIIRRSSFDPKSSVPDDKLSVFIEKNATLFVVMALSASRSLAMKGPSSKEFEWSMRAMMVAEIGRILVSNGMVFSARELDADPKIISKPRPGYTDLARTSNTQGTIELIVLMDADGTVKATLPIKPLANGLTEQAVAASRRIVFTPAQKAGKPVATLKVMSYSFTIY